MYEPIVHLVAEVKIIQAMQILSRGQMFSLLIKINEFYPEASYKSSGKKGPMNKMRGREGKRKGEGKGRKCKNSLYFLETFLLSFDLCKDMYS